MNSKNKTRLGLIFTVLFIILFVFVISIRQMEYGYIRDKKVRKDAYVYESNPDTNYGNNNFIRVGNLNSGRAEAYYCFDVSSLPNGWTEAIIIVNFNFASSLVDVGVNLTYERWDETAITWNNKPDHKSYRGHILNDGFSFNIPLKPANLTKNEVTISLYGKRGVTDGYIQGPSREGASDEHEVPFIRVTYPQIDPIVLTAITVGSILIFCVVILGLYLETRNREMKINQYITIRLEHGRTYIYMNGKKFIQCIQLVLNIPRDDIRFYEDIDSIDEAVKLNRVFTNQHNMIGGHFGVRRKNYRYKITAKQEFWGHCSV